MTLAGLTQLLFDIASVALLLIWYFPIRWITSASVHPVKVNAFLHATLSFERSAKAICMSFVAILPVCFFFFAQIHLLPKFIVAGHIGIWIATAPMFAITCYFQYYMLVFLKHYADKALQNDNVEIIDDLRHRCAEAFNLIELNKSLKASQMNMATEADKTIATLKNEIVKLKENNTTLKDRIAAFKVKDTKEYISPTISEEREQRSDEKYYVKVNELVRDGILLRDGEPVAPAHAKRYLTKAEAFIRVAKSGGPLYAKVVSLLRKGYEFSEKPLAKSLLYRCEPEEGEFYPLVPETPTNKGLSRFRMFADGEKAAN